VLASVAHLPRHHLGSTLYSPKLSVSKAASHSDPFGYVTTPRPLPYFAEKENCTVTVRIPAYHLRAESREEVIRRRAVWGVDIYTDDSDVLAALIHAGWVRGAWGDDVDVSLLDIDDDSDGDEEPANGEAAAAATTQTKLENPAPEKTATAADPKQPPLSQRKVPVQPPSGKDLHATLLILPALESYASTVSRGLRSRSWGANHDGLSFCIQTIDWVAASSESEKQQQQQLEQSQRGGEAKRLRLRRLLLSRANTKPGWKVRGAMAASRKSGKALEGAWAVQVIG
jgi:hypothetical protein